MREERRGRFCWRAGTERAVQALSGACGAGRLSFHADGIAVNRRFNALKPRLSPLAWDGWWPPARRHLPPLGGVFSSTKFQSDLMEQGIQPLSLATVQCLPNSLLNQKVHSIQPTFGDLSNIGLQK